MRKVAVPANRYTPLKENWMKIFTPVVEHLQLQIRFNLKTRNVEIKVGAVGWPRLLPWGARRVRGVQRHSREGKHAPAAKINVFRSK